MSPGGGCGDCLVPAADYQKSRSEAEMGGGGGHQAPMQVA